MVSPQWFLLDFQIIWRLLVQCIPTYNICRTSQVMSETMFISSIHWSSCMFILFIYVYLYSSKSYPEFLLSLYWYNCIFYFILLHTCLFILFLYIGLYIYIYIFSLSICLYCFPDMVWLNMQVLLWLTMCFMQFSSIFHAYVWWYLSQFGHN